MFLFVRILSISTNPALWNFPFFLWFAFYLFSLHLFVHGAEVQKRPSGCCFEFWSSSSSLAASITLFLCWLLKFISVLIVEVSFTFRRWCLFIYRDCRGILPSGEILLISTRTIVVDFPFPVQLIKQIKIGGTPLHLRDPNNNCIEVYFQWMSKKLIIFNANTQLKEICS